VWRRDWSQAAYSPLRWRSSATSCRSTSPGRDRAAARDRLTARHRLVRRRRDRRLARLARRLRHSRALRPDVTIARSSPARLVTTPSRVSTGLRVVSNFRSIFRRSARQGVLISCLRAISIHGLFPYVGSSCLRSARPAPPSPGSLIAACVGRRLLFAVGAGVVARVREHYLMVAAARSPATG